MIFFCIIAFLVKCFFWRQVSYSFFLARQVRLFSPIINEFYLQEKCVFCNFSTIIALVIFLQKHDKKKRIKQIIQWSPFMLLLYWLYLWGVTLRTCGLLLDSILKTWSPKISFFYLVVFCCNTIFIICLGLGHTWKNEKMFTFKTILINLISHYGALHVL